MAAPRPLAWYLGYVTGWTIGLGVLGVLLASCAVELLAHSAPAIDPWVLGGTVGGLVGSGCALRSFDRPLVHHRLRHTGAVLSLALPLAGVLFAWSESERTYGLRYAGLGELLLAFLCLILGIAGAALLLAGISGRRLLGA